MVDTQAAAPNRAAMAYVDYHEERDHSGGGGQSKDHRHRSVRFFLHDDKGSQILAVIGDDMGDAHYKYHNAPGFNSYGTIDVRTRKEVIQWLEMIIHETQLQARDGVQEEVEHLGEQTPSNPEGLYYVRHEVMRDHLPDNRRVNRWFLIDQNEQLHLAVQGEERDARDGHYIYSSREPFASIKPMGTCTNQQQVMHWLENFITHHGKAGMHVGDHIRSGPYNPHMRGRPPNKHRSPHPTGKSPDSSPINPERRSKRARLPTDRVGEPLPKRVASPQTTAPSPMSRSKPAQALKAASKVSRAAPSSKNSGVPRIAPKAPAKTPPAHATEVAGLDLAAGVEGGSIASAYGGTGQTPRTGVRLGGAAEASQARRMKAVQSAAKSQVAMLHRVIKADVCKQLETAQKAHDAAKAAAVQWCLQPTPQGDVAHAEAYLPGILAALRTEHIAIPPPTAAAIDGIGPASAAPVPAAEHVELLEALREVAKVYAAADLLVSKHVVALFSACEQHSLPAVRTLASDALNGWRRITLAHLRFLADPAAALNPLTMFKEADSQGTIEIILPEHLKLALEGTLPSAKQKNPPTPLESAQNLPKQHDIKPCAAPPTVTAAVKPKEDPPRQSISFGGMDQSGPAATPDAAAGTAPAGLLTVQGHRTDKTVSNTPCMPNFSPADNAHAEQVTPQLLGGPSACTEPHSAAQQPAAEQLTPTQAHEQQPQEQEEGENAVQHAGHDIHKDPDPFQDMPEQQVQEQGNTVPASIDAAAAATEIPSGAAAVDKMLDAVLGAEDAAVAGAAAAEDQEAGKSILEGAKEPVAADADAAHQEEAVDATSTAPEAGATFEGTMDGAGDMNVSIKGLKEEVQGAVDAQREGSLMREDDAASVSRETPAPVEGGDEEQGPMHGAEGGSDGNGVAAETDGAEEGETIGSNGNGSAGSKVVSASKVASATSRADSQEWGGAEDVADILASMPVPAQPTVPAVYAYVQQLRSMLFHVPPAALVDLCGRVVEATQGMLQQAPEAEFQAIPANQQMEASAMMLMSVSGNLLPNMAPSERQEVIKMLESQLRDLENCLRFHHQSTAAGS